MQDISAAGTAFECYHPNGAKLTDDVVESCTRHGIKINAWTINDMALLEKLADLNCSGVITNFPGICRAWRGIAGNREVYFTCGKAEKLLKEQRTELLEKRNYLSSIWMMGHFTWETGFWMERWTS